MRHPLKIDVDPGQPLLPVQEMRNLLERAGFQLLSRVKERSGSGKGWHVYVYVAPQPTNTEMVALQAILGSDRYREACNVGRVRTLATLRGGFGTYWSSPDRWNVFYDGKWEGR